MGSTEKDLKPQVLFNSLGGVMIALGEHAISLSRAEAEQLFVDLGHVLQDQDIIAHEIETGKAESENDV